MYCSFMRMLAGPDSVFGRKKTFQNFSCSPSVQAAVSLTLPTATMARVVSWARIAAITLPRWV